MRSIVAQISEAAGWLREAATRLSVRRENEPIADCDQFYYFIHTRAALVSQKKLYGYVKERMGISYPRHFADEAFGRSMNIAKMHVFAAALSDMTIYAVGQTRAGTDIDDAACRDMALACYRVGIDANREQAVDQGMVPLWLADFQSRVDAIHWNNLASGGAAFTRCAKALVHWAPIADEHKRHDREIVENSIRFAWNEVREDLRVRLDAASVVADFRQSTA